MTVISAACRSNTRGSVVNLKQQRQTALIDCSSPLCLERSAHPSEHRLQTENLFHARLAIQLIRTEKSRLAEHKEYQSNPMNLHMLKMRTLVTCRKASMLRRHFHYRAIAQTMPSEDVRPSVRPSVRHIRRVVSKQQLNMS